MERIYFAAVNPVFAAPPGLRVTEFDKALVKGDVKTAAKELRDLPSQDEIKELFKDARLDAILSGIFKLEDIPIWHHLGRFRFQENELPYLIELLKHYVDSGNDINRTADGYKGKKLSPLIAAIDQSNPILVEALITCGADINFRDRNGNSPCHWAIRCGEISILKKLIEAGAVITSTPREIPILHIAVDQWQQEIVEYILDGGLVDINKEANYDGIPEEQPAAVASTSDTWREEFVSRLTAEFERLRDLMAGPPLAASQTEQRQSDDIHTPLSRAIKVRNVPILEMLLKRGAKLNGLKELHISIMEGNTEISCLLKKYYSKEELKNDKINGMWALHCLHHDAFQCAETTIDLIKEYINAGWNVNEVSPRVTAYITRSIQMLIPADVTFLTNCTLLHVACLHGGTEVVRFLVDAGADMNSPAFIEGGAHLQPIQLSMLVDDLETVKFLMERGADFTKIGYFEISWFTRVERSGKEHQQFSSAELLLRLDWSGKEDIVSQMLDGTDFGLSDLYIAVEGGNPRLITKVLKALGPKTPTKDLTYVPIRSDRNFLMIIGVKKIPLLSLFFKPLTPMYQPGTMPKELSSIAEMLETFGQVGYDFGANPGPLSDVIMNAIRLDYQYKSNMLLTTLLRVDSVQINPPWNEDNFFIKQLLTNWDVDCARRLPCWLTHERPHYLNDIKLLVRHGLDVSKLKITGRFRYHFGFSELMKQLYRAGAQIMPDFFDGDNICKSRYSRGLKKELEELEEWTKEQDEKRLNLQFLCRVKLRSMIQKVGDIPLVLDPERVPPSVRDSVLCRKIFD